MCVFRCSEEKQDWEFFFFYFLSSLKRVQQNAGVYIIGGTTFKIYKNERNDKDVRFA